MVYNLQYFFQSISLLVVGQSLNWIKVLRPTIP